MQIQKPTLYWLGNSAKTKIIQDLLTRLPDAGEVLVFDYGCGDGGDWAAVLTDHPQLRLIGYEPIQASAEKANRSLRGLKAEIFTGDVEQLNFHADFIVSFSVFEHVFDRRRYLDTAARLMADDGLFYLNYDDGHFRNMLDLNAPRTWAPTMREWFHNLLAVPAMKFGLSAQYQQRVIKREVDTLIVSCGFRLERDEYSNLASFKALAKAMPLEHQQAFVQLWLDVEHTLNNQFARTGTPNHGDDTILWRQMGSRTLYLRRSTS